MLFEKNIGFIRCCRRLFAALVIVLAACADSAQDGQQIALETLREQDFQDLLRVDGELRSAEVTPLNVPGGNFEQRVLEFMVPDGSRVEKDQLIARFRADIAAKDLSLQERNLLRNALKLANERASSQTNAAQIQTDRSDIEGQLGLSERYASLDPNASWVSKNELLDKLQDLDLLKDKKSTADWRVSHQQQLSSANSEVTLAQRQSVQALVDRNRASLAALELRAPHAGVLKLNSNWDGSKIQIGGSAWAGDDFATLPDLSRLIARFSLPQSEAGGLSEGQRVSIRLSGTGELLEAKVLRVGASASVRSRESPVKYVEVDASFETALIERFRLSPGMAVSATIFRIEAKNVLSVPNTALKLAAGSDLAETAPSASRAPIRLNFPGGKMPSQAQLSAALSAGAPETKAMPQPAAVERDAWVVLPDGTERKVKIGQQGNARSVVLSGLLAGEQIRILRPDLKADGDTVPAAAFGAAAKSGANSGARQ